jgi:hypothetical protein
MTADVYDGRDQAARNADPAWWATAMEAVEAKAATGLPFQMYDVVLEKKLEEPDTPKRWGALAAACHKLGIIEPVGVTESSRPATCRSLVRVWRGPS